MNTISMIFVVVTAIFLGIGFWVVNRKPEPPRKYGSGATKR